MGLLMILAGALKNMLNTGIAELSDIQQMLANDRSWLHGGTR
jgi:hypothetical protein